MLAGEAAMEEGAPLADIGSSGQEMQISGNSKHCL